MNNQQIQKLYKFKKDIDLLKSEEDLVSVLLQFLKEDNLITPLVAVVTADNYGGGNLYGISEFNASEINTVKDEIITHIETVTGMNFRCKRLMVFVEEVKTEEKQALNLEKIYVIPMKLEGKMHGAMLIYMTGDMLPNQDIYHLLLWLFQERYFLLSRKHQELLYLKMQVINEAREMIYSAIKLDDMFSILGDIVLKHAKADMGCVLLGENQELKIRVSWRKDITKDENIMADEFQSEFERDYPESLEILTLDDKGKLLDYIGNEMRVIKLDSVKIPKMDDQDCIDFIIPEMLFIPLIIREKVIGYLCVIRKHFVKEKFGDNDISILETIVSLAAASIENNRLYDQTLKEQMTQKELQVAHNIQVSMQAKYRPKLNNFSISATSIPARVIGGDYYDYFPLNDGRLGITLTDIVGKGIPAALIMAFFKGIMQSSVFGGEDPDAIFAAVNENLYKNKSVKNYIPSVYAILDDETNTLIYTNAGHENPFYYHHEEDKFMLLEEGGLPLGAFSGSEYDKGQLKMESGDIVVMFTDGVTEARNVVEDSYGEERLENLIRSYKHLNSEELVDKIKEDILIYSQNIPLHDDFTIIVVKRN